MSSQFSRQQSGPHGVHSTYAPSKPEMNKKRAKTSHQNASILPLTSSNTNIPPSLGPLSILPLSNLQQTEHLTQGMPQQYHDQ